MIVSIHLPKTAGMTFGELLGRQFGDRLLRDYEDFSGFRSPEALAQCAANAVRARSKTDELLANYDAIHGHFIADKYLGLFPDGKFVAFFRDPFQQAVSHYDFLLRHAHLRHPVVKAFHAAKMTLPEFIAWEATKEPQTMFLGNLPIEGLAMVGLTEQFPLSLALFRATFGRDIGGGIVNNTNPERFGQRYDIGRDLRKIIEVHRAADIALFRRAKELFASQVTHRRVCS